MADRPDLLTLLSPKGEEKINPSTLWGEGKRVRGRRDFRGATPEYLEMEKVYIAIGSNKGKREKNIIKALKRMEEAITIKKISSFFITPPEEGAKGGFFINGVIEGKTALPPLKLFLFLQEIEKDIGRPFPHKKGDEREIDLDIILYGDRVIKNSKISIPHPRYRKRYFVIFPLYEIAPDIKDPETEESVSDIYRRLIKNGGSRKNRRCKE